MSAPAIGLRSRWAPPASAVLDRTHPLAHGLIHCIRPIGPKVVDLITGRDLTVDSTAASGASRLGRALRSAGAATGAYLPLTSAPTYPLSMTWVGDVDLSSASSGGSGIFMYSWGTSSGWSTDTSPFALGIDYGGSGALGVNRVNGSTYVGGLSGGSPGFISGAITFTNENVSQFLYVNGSVVGSGSNVTSNPTSTNFSGLGFQRHSNTSGRVQAASGVLGLVHNRILSAADVASLHADPFQIFRQ